MKLGWMINLKSILISLKRRERSESITIGQMEIMTKISLVLGRCRESEQCCLAGWDRFYSDRGNTVVTSISPKGSSKEFGFLLLDESKSGDDVKIRQEDYKFADLKNHSQIFLRDDDPTVLYQPIPMSTISV